MKRYCFAIFACALISFTSQARQMSNFDDGPLIQKYGKHAPVAKPHVDESSKFKVAFDVAAAAKAGEINKRFDSLARFINMHVAAGVAKENIELALVVHGRAALDLLKNESYQRVNSTNNANIELLNVLMKNQVSVVLCGQTANAYEIQQNQLVDGVRIELSAMTAHALLQQQGYTVNPF
ncbi:DsrE family protein [Glaciecola siphonariae]|uniref:DsrE family protein n=1 Tax=Glaciecola siphonariae TaxID=521012 RepID=A0ABV9LRP0_9ALTE